MIAHIGDAPGEELIPTTVGAGAAVLLARAAQTRIVLAAGAESEGEMANRGTHAMADGLGKSPVTLPSDHGGFFGGEYGQTGDPDAFAATLRATPDRELIRSQ